MAHQDAIEATSNSINVLLIEDEPGDRELLRHGFSQIESPVNLTEVSTLAEATALLADKCRDQFDCILLDLHLPNGAGLQLIRDVRAVCGEIVLIVHTSRKDEPLRRYFDAGADDFIPKGEPGVQVEAMVLSARRRTAVRKRRNSGWEEIASGMRVLERHTDALLEGRVYQSGKSASVE